MSISLADFPIGQRAEVSAIITAEMIDAFAKLSGDDNRVHMDAATARAAGFSDRVAHGCLTLSLLSTLIGTRLPGAGALWRSVDVDWTRPVFPGDAITISGEVVQRSTAAQSIVIRAVGTNQAGTVVLRASATVGLVAAEVDSAMPEVAARASEDSAPPVASGHVSSSRAVLVTGASRGIGRAVALALGAAGHPVAVGFHRNETAAREVVTAIASAGGRAEPLALDVVSGQIELSAAASLGPLTALVHAASPPLTARGSDDPVFAEDLQRYLDAYVMSGIQLVRQLWPAIRSARWGRVVFVGTSAIIGTPPAKMTAYVTAKSALVGLTHSLALELGPLGATVNLVSPGLTVTDLTRDVSPRAQLVEAQRTPTRRLATPEDTAHTVRFLFSDGGAQVTGAHLPITGGVGML